MSTAQIALLVSAIEDSIAYYMDLIVDSIPLFQVVIVLCIVMGFITFLLRKMFSWARFSRH